MINVKRIESILISECFDKAEILSITDTKELFTLAYHYNWDDGFELPTTILQNRHCDISTALMIFHLADGYTALSKNFQFDSSDYEVWIDFLINTKNMIVNGDFKKGEIMFEPPYTEIQIEELRKNCPEFSDILLAKIDGESFEIPDIDAW